MRNLNKKKNNTKNYREEKHTIVCFIKLISLCFHVDNVMLYQIPQQRHQTV